MKSFKKHALPFALLLTLIVSLFGNVSSATAAGSLDSASAWAKEGITAAVSKGFVPTDLQNNYTNVITRQEFCRMAVKWLEYVLSKPIAEIVTERGSSEKMGHTFSDTADPYILAAYRLGITNGTVAPTATTPGQFTPNGEFSREQAATMIRNVCNAAGMDISNITSAGFNDIGEASSWAVDGINFVRNNGIMQGTSIAPPLFNPKATYTREQSILTFNNIDVEKMGISNNPTVNISIVGTWVLENIEISGSVISENEYRNLFPLGIPYYWFNEDKTVSMFNFSVEYDASNNTYIDTVGIGKYVENGNTISITDIEENITTLTKNDDILIRQSDGVIMRFRFQWITE